MWSEPEFEVGTAVGAPPWAGPSWQKSYLPAERRECKGKMKNDISAVGGLLARVHVRLGNWGLDSGTSGASPPSRASWRTPVKRSAKLGHGAFYEHPRELFDVTEGSNERLTGTAIPRLRAPLYRRREVLLSPRGSAMTGRRVGAPDGIPGALLPHVSKIEPDEGPTAGQNDGDDHGRELHRRYGGEFRADQSGKLQSQLGDVDNGRIAAGTGRRLWHG